jgi:hypothetical protein
MATRMQGAMERKLQALGSNKQAVAVGEPSYTFSKRRMRKKIPA